MAKQTQIETYEKLAKKLSNLNSKSVFVKDLRNKLLSHAAGKVLEVGVGPGTNFQFYPPDVAITAVDFSPSLLNMARSAAQSLGLHIDFIESDVEQLELEDNAFDTVVSTHSLCAYDDPLRVLKNFNRYCRTDGRILLLEHGLSTNRSYSSIVNLVIKWIDGWNVKHVGCHTNRDILKLVEESCIQIERVETSFLGLHYMVIGKPRKNAL